MARSGDSDDDDLKQRPRLALPTDHEVGYGKPPVSTRVQPGKSGNPSGRPKGAKNRRPALNAERLKSIVLEEAYRTIKVRDGTRNVSVPMATAIVRSLAVNAAKGNNRAATIFSTLLQTTERENRDLHNQWLDTAITYKVQWTKELERRERLGIVAEAPLPHPDDIVINHRTGMVRILGPMNKEDKQLWDAARDLKQELSDAVAWSEKKLARERDPVKRQRLLESISHDRDLIARIERLIPDRKDLDWMN